MGEMLHETSDEMNGLCSHKLTMVYSWDAVVVTCPTARSAVGIREELMLMQKQGLFASTTSLLTVEDPDFGIGSGGATLNAILVVAEYLSVKRGFQNVNSEVFKNSHILIVHNGRSYPYEPCGKAFIPLRRGRRRTDVQTSGSSFVSNTNFGNLLEIVESLAVRGCCGQGVWICSSDALIRIKANATTLPWTSAAVDCALFTIPCDADYATQHGVVRVSSSDSRPGYIVDDILYRRSVADLQDCRFEDGTVPVVCGIVFLSPAVTRSLFSLQSRVPIDGCTYLGTDSGTSAIQMSLFFDILAAMSCKISSDDFMNGNCGKTYGLHFGRPDSRTDSMTKVRSMVWKELRKYTMNAVILTNVEYRYWPEQLSASHHLDIVRLSNEGNDMKAKVVGLIDINSALSHVEVVGGEEEVINGLPAIVQNCVLRGTSEHPIRIGRGSMVSGIVHIQETGSEPLSFPPNVFLMRIRLGRRDVHVLFSTEDRIFASFTDPLATVFGMSWDDFLKKADISLEELWNHGNSQKTFFNANLFPINDGLEQLLWLAGPAKITSNSKFGRLADQERLSLSTILANVDVPSEFSFRRDGISLRLAIDEVRRVILEDGRQESLLPLFERASCELWVTGLLDEMDEMAWNCVGDGSGRAARVFANIADLLGCLAACEGGFRSGPAANKEWTQILDALETNVKGNIRNGMADLRELRRSWMDSPQRMIRAARHYEAAAQTLNRNVVATADSFVKIVPSDCPPRFGDWVVSESPARIDLFGGWTDTPPICYELGGSVVNASIMLNGIRPIGAKVRRVRSASIQIHSDDGSYMTIDCIDAMRDYKKPSSPGALVKACMLYTKIVQLDEGQHGSLVDQLERKYGGGFEIHTWSKLPLGSGLGTSSILAGAILTSLWLATGNKLDRLSVIHAVLCVEQMMTTGGGWQDQVGGLMGGIIHGESGLVYEHSDDDLNSLPPGGRLKVQVRKLELDVEIMSRLRRHLIVVYTGTARLARNLLQNVLRNWYCRDAAVYNTFRTLYDMSYNCVEAIQRGNLDEIGDFMNRYWELKKILTPGAEPDHVTAIMACLKPHVYGQLLCGAGGGGHLVLLSRQPDAQFLIREAIAKLPDVEEVVVMEASIAEDGLCVSIGGVKVVIA